MEILQVQQLARRIAKNVGQVIIGKDNEIGKVLTALLSGGHILLEDIPGTGKTTLAKAMAQSIGCDFGRIQFTPDLLPSDLTGINYYHQNKGEFVFRPGPVFTSILLADEINRATPRTQSSLLECMEEHQVTIDGVTHKLESPFLVIATQNPVEIQGTFPLPEAQLDRFFLRLSMGYPDAESECAMLRRPTGTSPDQLDPVVQREDILAAQQAVGTVSVSQAVDHYIVAIVSATRTHEKIRLGSSPRGSIALRRASQATAAMDGRDYVLPDDVKAVCLDVLAHRILCRGHAAAQSAAYAQELLEEILGKVEVPMVHTGDEK